MPQFKFSKFEKLKSEKLIASLFKSGNRVKSYPLRAIYVSQEPYKDLKAPILFGVTVPKKQFKRAVDRNKIKRLIREAYRLNAQPLRDKMSALEQQLVVMIIFLDKEIPEYNQVEKHMIKLLEKLLKIEYPAQS